MDCLMKDGCFRQGYDFDIINELDKEDYIQQGSRRFKSVSITNEGMKLFKASIL